MGLPGRINTTDNERRPLKQPLGMAATTALREAFNQGISSGSLGDTKFILYSHRDSSGRVCRPKALYANSHVLKTVPYFQTREPTITLDIIHAEPHGVGLKVRIGNFAGPQLKDSNKEEIDDEEYAEGYGYLSDSDLEDDEDEKAASFKPTGKSKAHLFDPFGVPSGCRIIPCEEHEERVERRKTIKIPDMAFVT